MSKVFISYARDESCGQILATETQLQLEAAGINVFRDITGLKGGDYWLRKLEEELRASDVVVLVLSQKVLVSKWVPNEINLAEELGIPVIPIYAEHIQLPLWLRHLQVIDFVSVMPWMKLQGAIISQIEERQPPNTDKEVISSNEDSIELPPTIIATPYIHTDPKQKPGHDDSVDPSWATNSGKDKYGLYADLKLHDVTQRFRFIEPGSFWMGSPESEVDREFLGRKETRHKVKISQPFWLADAACTQALWKSILGNSPAGFKGNDNNPVERVSWDDAQEFIQALDNMKLGASFHLPTEAQWEYACRAGTETPFSFGENITPDQVNYDGGYPYNNAMKGLYREKTVSVKSLPANAWGLYEMHGNVWEWCEDAYQEDLGGEDCTDPVHKSGSLRVIRGGSWYDRLP